ncbi:MAG: hypothetical protein JXR51_13600 [Bacteroidales bacterium]|nr:hypothetical protein [Bacteroidales bacterium]MBN2758202.1 hypothetical protein [Bacteroidales bacterium]
MIYTIKIDSSSKQAKSIIEFLNTLASDYDFIQIEEENSTELSAEQEEELDKRYGLYLKNPNIGKTWEETKANL